jgi:Domain of unknown function (DUF4326)
MQNLWPTSSNLPQVLNKYKTKPTSGAINIMRPSKWGNPFIIGRDGTREQVVNKYEIWFEEQPALIAALPELCGHDLVCCCTPKVCHGNFLVRRANRKIKK